MKALANSIAIVTYTAAAAFVLWMLDLDPWWAPAASLVAIGIYFFVFAVAHQLGKIAGAVYLRNAQQEAATDQDPKEAEWVSEEIKAALATEAEATKPS